MAGTRKLKLILTFSCYFSYFAFAFAFYIVSPTLLDIKENVNSTFQDVSYGIVVRSTTYCFGALFSGWIFNKIDRTLGLIISTILMAVTNCLVPFIDQLVYFLVVLGVMGFASAGVEVAVNAWILQLWQEDCNIYMQGMHFAYAIGVTIAPTLAAPFLSESGEEEINHNSTVVHKLLNYSQHDDEMLSTSMKSVTTLNDLSKGLFIPYLITAIVLIMSAVVQMIFYLILPYSEVERCPQVTSTPTSKRDTVIASTISDDDHCKETSLLTGTGESQSKIETNHSSSYKCIMVISGCALTCFYAGLEMNTFIFLPDFAVTALNYSKANAAIVTSYLSASYAIFRFISIFIASQVTTIKMLYAHVSLIGLSNCIIWYATFHSPSHLLFTIGSILLGAGCSCVYPAIYAYLEEKITVTNNLCGLFMFSSSIATSINPILEGRYLEKYPSIFVLINTIGFAYVLMILVMLEVTYRKRK